MSAPERVPSASGTAPIALLGALPGALLGALLAVSGCVLPSRPLPPALTDDAPHDGRDRRRAVARPQVTDARVEVAALDMRAIPVRLAAFDGTERVHVANTTRGDLELSVLGTRVRASDGTLEAIQVLASRGGPLLVEGKPFAGKLVVRAERGALAVTNLVDLEDYVRGVVAGESVLWSASAAELETQAIAARSYAIATLHERARDPQPFLWSDTRDQVYVGVWRGRDSAGDRKVAARLDAAVDATRGRVLGDGRRVLDCRFHASCGGRTAAFRDIFGTDSTASALPSVQCPPCRGRAARERAQRLENGDVAWRFTADEGGLARIARELELGTRVVSMTPAEADAHGRWLSVELAGDRRTQRVSFEELRRVLDPARLKSACVVGTWPRFGEEITGGLLFDGVGRGHGVGLCQIGARDMADAGWSAAEILAHYYPGSRLGRVSSGGDFLTARGDG